MTRPQPLIVKSFAVVTTILAAVIVYGSLYPFSFHIPGGGPGPIETILQDWNRRPGRGDFVSNILLYVPLGFFAMSALGPRLNTKIRIVVAALLGMGLSLCIEVLQYFDAGRNPAASDLYSNSIGTWIGIGLTFALTNMRAERYFGQRLSHRTPLMLLTAWAGYKLYPFVPVIDLHKYWNALKPLVLYPSISAYEIFTHAASWMAAAALTSRAVDGKGEVFWFAAFITLVMCAKVFIMSASLSWDDILGAAIALCWLLFTREKDGVRITVTLAVLLLAVLAMRLEPFKFAASTGAFGWIPFASFMHGSINVNVLSFLEKFFLYGSLIWLLREQGVKLPLATILVAAALLATSIMQIYIPERSAEITDCVMAIIVGIALAMVASGEPANPTTPASRWRR